MAALREERQRLERAAAGLGTSLREAANELANIERRISASRAVLAELRSQEEEASRFVARNAVERARTRDDLAAAKALLHGRVRDIYKAGPRRTLRAVLGASSSGELIVRYRYLRRLAEMDRSLVGRTIELEERLRSDSSAFELRVAELARLKLEGLAEAARLGSEEGERLQAVAEFRRRTSQARTGIERLSADEERMAALVEDLETRRRARERAWELAAARNEDGTDVPSTDENAGAAGGGSGDGAFQAGEPAISIEDAGTLPWPMAGALIYGFGRERREDGTVLRRTGVGIAADPGTRVAAVAAGRVELAGHFEGYGPTVIVNHGGGIYTLYLYLDEIDAVQGRAIVTGERLGTVGASAAPEGPHLEFQVWVASGGEPPRAEDPLGWLEAGF